MHQPVQPLLEVQVPDEVRTQSDTPNHEFTRRSCKQKSARRQSAAQVRSTYDIRPFFNFNKKQTKRGLPSLEMVDRNIPGTRRVRQPGIIPWNAWLEFQFTLVNFSGNCKLWTFSRSISIRAVSPMLIYYALQTVTSIGRPYVGSTLAPKLASKKHKFGLKKWEDGSRSIAGHVSVPCLFV